MVTSCEAAAGAPVVVVADMPLVVVLLAAGVPELALELVAAAGAESCVLLSWQPTTATRAARASQRDLSFMRDSLGLRNDDAAE
jgi:hypothetical protein